jgi:N-acetylglucosamine-6-phosphate deacetylase
MTRSSDWPKATATFAGFWGTWALAVSDSCILLDIGTVLSPFDKFSPGRVVIRGGRIEAVGLVSDVRTPDNAIRFGASNMTLVPGFIEPHIHGCAGVDVMDATPESMSTICRALARHGTTAFLPTTVSAPVEALSSAIERIADLIRTPSAGAQPLGIHMEGPFLNVEKRGTHQPSHVRLPDGMLLSNWITRSKGTIRLLTIAPELEGAAKVSTQGREFGVVVAMGHSNASFAQASAAADAGTRYAVHTFNAMRQFSHRDPGIVGAVLTDERIFAEIIADGIHVAPETVRLFAKAKGPARILLATDGTSATGMPDGAYALGSRQVQVRGGICRDEEGRLAGSTLTQDRALRNLLDWTRMSLADALLGLTVNPATALSLEGRGRIAPGAFADLTLLDQNLQVSRTYVAGAVVFDRSA